MGEQAGADVLCLENLLAVAFDPAVGDAEIQLAADDAFEVEMELQQLGGRQHLAHELHLADRQRPAGARPAEPAESEAEQLPQRVHPEATRHYRVVLEMALKEPEAGLDVELGLDLALAVGATLLGNVRWARLRVGKVGVGTCRSQW